jgi:hypothetical protein
LFGRNFDLGSFAMKPHHHPQGFDITPLVPIQRRSHSDISSQHMQTFEVNPTHNQTVPDHPGQMIDANE